jgi:hypothetical protein
MPRRSKSAEEERRAQRLAAALKRGKDEHARTVQQISDQSRVPYETVRAVLGAKNAGPSFFIVADVAKAIGLDLDELAEEAR